MEGVKMTTKDTSLQIRNVSNLYTFHVLTVLRRTLWKEGLVEYCKLSSSTDTRSVVCPVCASMPWGDLNYYSTNFIENTSNARASFPWIMVLMKRT